MTIIAIQCRFQIDPATMHCTWDAAGILRITFAKVMSCLL